MPIKQLDHEYDYDVEFVVDQTKWRPLPDAEDADEEFEFETILEVTKNGFSSCEKHGMSKPQTEVYDYVRELLAEWQNLVFNNDCKDRKVKVTIKVEEVA